MSVARLHESELPSLADFEALARTRRSVRSYRPEPLGGDLIDRLLDAARWAPSNFNRQPWEFVVAADPDWCAALAELAVARMDQAEAATDDPDLLRAVGHARRWIAPVAHSPCTVLVFYRRHCERRGGGVEALLGTHDLSAWNPDLLSVGMAMQNLLLAAHAAGLGACAHSGPVAFLRGVVHELLGLPPRLELAALVTVGRPGEVPSPKSRRALERKRRVLPPRRPEGAR